MNSCARATTSMWSAHYARADVFSLHVDERPKRPVVFGASAGQGRPRAGRRPRESTRLRQRIGVSAIRM
ncbi:nitrilase [Burkholderia multivorans]|nr:nitrilase [Burkholderia multivorans R-20526]PRG92079.1 nitrilase [Burkholderia multivorans]QET29826.1 nitrilase [Burkholderia multivorans]QET39603.1 nitrilase [Burkholderia multivorans]